MTKPLKIALIVLACVVVFCSGVVGVGYYWIKTNGKQYFNEMAKSADKTIGEGREFGVSTDNDECLKEALRRFKKEDSFTSNLDADFFLLGCLESSKATATFCKDVPPKSEIIKSVQWQIQKCKELGDNSRTCQQLFATVQRHCEDVRRDEKDKLKNQKSSLNMMMFQKEQ